MEHTYWNNKGKFQADYDRLLPFMPDSGPADTAAGEIIRAISKLGYDFYNNGMGNNTSGAVNYLRRMAAIDQETYQTIYAYTRGQTYEGYYDGDELHTAIENMVDSAVYFIKTNPYLETLPNTVDMFEFEDEFENFDEDYY